MKEPLQKVLRQLLDEISDQKFADLIFRLFISMPDAFYKNPAYDLNPIPLAEHLVLTAVLALRKIKKWSIGRSRGMIQRVTDETMIVCLFHDFWKFNWTEDPPKRIKGDHGLVSGDKIFEFIKESKFSEKSKNRIVGSIFYHVGKRKPIIVENIPKETRARKFLAGPDGQTYKIYEKETRMFKPMEVVKCTLDCR